MIQTAEEIAKQSKGIEKEVGEECKKVPLIVEIDKGFKIQKEFNSLKEYLVGLQQDINAKDEKEFTDNDKKVLQKSGVLLSTTEDFAKILRDNAKYIVKTTIESRAENLRRHYYEAFKEFKNKIAIEPLFTKDFNKENLIFRYADGSKYEIGRKFKTTIKRYVANTGSGMTEAIQTRDQIKIEGYIFAAIKDGQKIMFFTLEDKNYEPIISPHSSKDGFVCLGTLNQTPFMKNMQDNIKGKNWKNVSEEFGKIEALFETVNWGGAYHHRGSKYLENSTSSNDMYAKLKKLSSKLDEVFETNYTTYGEDEEEDDNF